MISSASFAVAAKAAGSAEALGRRPTATTCTRKRQSRHEESQKAIRARPARLVRLHNNGDYHGHMHSITQAEIGALREPICTAVTDAVSVCLGNTAYCFENRGQQSSTGRKPSNSPSTASIDLRRSRQGKNGTPAAGLLRTLSCHMTHTDSHFRCIAPKATANNL